MSKAIKSVLVIGLAALVVACAQPEEEYVVVDPEPISTEPVYTGKYKYDQCGAGGFVRSALPPRSR